VDTGAPSVSVVIPVFNRASVLRRAIDSALSQTLTALEVIVVDDGSTDGSASVAEEVGDRRVRVLRRASRRGVSAARNVGIEAARADIVAFLDSDDEWLPRKLERQVARLSEGPEPAKVVYCAFERYDDGAQQALGRSPQGVEGDVYRRLLAGWHPGNASVFAVSRAGVQAAGGFDEALLTAEDYDLWLRLARAGHRFAVVDELLAVKHENGSLQLTRDPAARRRSQRRLDARWGPVIAAELGREGYRAWRADRRRQLAAAYLVQSMDAAQRGNWPLALRSTIGLLSLLPGSWPMVPAGLASALLGRRGYRVARRVHRAARPSDRGADRG
jgi:glycosyltransferase involved in cell wall biosynthesis